MSIFLAENFDFRGQINTFEAEIITKSWSSIAENNAYTLPKKLLKTFEKVQKTTFLTHKMVKITPQNRQN